MSQKLRKIMVENVVTVEPSASLRKAAELMNLHEIGCLVVVHSGKPVGILTERDMIKRVICRGKEGKAARVVDVMSKPIVTASPNMRAGDAAKLMFERNIKKLPVVENGRLVGLVTLTDLLRSEGVVEFLNGVALNGSSNHMRKAASLYFDSLRMQRRRCPLIMKGGFSMGCQSGKCMWWVGDECVVTRISRQLSVGVFPEADVTEQTPSEE